MKKINFKIKNVRLAFTLLIILAFIVLLLYYHFVLSPSFAKSNFTNQMIEIADENENSIFNVQKYYYIAVLMLLAILKINL